MTALAALLLTLALPAFAQTRKPSVDWDRLGFGDLAERLSAKEYQPKPAPCELPAVDAAALWCARGVGGRAPLRQVSWSRRMPCRPAGSKQEKPVVQDIRALYEIGAEDGRVVVEQAVFFRGLAADRALRARFREALERAKPAIAAMFARHMVVWRLVYAIDGEGPAPAGPHSVVTLHDGFGRSNRGNWYLRGFSSENREQGLDHYPTFETLVGHELAHHLGFPDAYVDVQHRCPLVYGEQGRSARRGPSVRCPDSAPPGAACVNLMGDPSAGALARVWFDHAEFADLLRPLCPWLCRP